MATREHAKSWVLVSIATPGCGSSIASLTHRTAFGPSSPRLRARDVPERGPAPHDFACSQIRPATARTRAGRGRAPSRRRVQRSAIGRSAVPATLPRMALVVAT
jgi:hypothetical protein